MAALVLAIDVGSSSARCSAYDTSACVVAGSAQKVCWLFGSAAPACPMLPLPRPRGGRAPIFP